MSDISANLSLPLIQPSQAQKHVTHNEALQRLDALVQLVVADRDRTAPPASPAEGDRHIVASGATGDWSGRDGEIAAFQNGGWQFYAALDGWRAEIGAEAVQVIFGGGAWAIRDQQSDNLPGIGINTTSDANNRLAVASPAVLLTHEGAGHQLKINKAASTDTASLLFQTGFSGRAEMGTTGSDGFAVKVSPDGAAWFDALRADPATGVVEMPQGAAMDGAVTGLAVQQSAGDVTAGRLMRADFGYGPGNLVGAVSETSGQPTGAVIERGSNANGDYTRFADGTQICAHRIALPQSAASHCRADWTFPAAFQDMLHASGTIDLDASAATPGPDELGPVLWSDSGSGTTSARLSVYRQTGATAFQAADQITVLAYAFGRWF